MQSTPSPPSLRHTALAVFRTPLLPFDDFLAWSGEPGAPAALDGDDAELSLALAADRAALRQRLTAVLACPEVRDALFIASPDLERGLAVWSADPEGKQGRRVEQSLVRYFARMSGRSTPFGLFAGWAVGCVGDATRLELAGRESYRRRTRIDLGILWELADVLARDASLQEELGWWPNSSLYRVGEQLRYVEGRVHGGTVAYQLSAVSRSPYLDVAVAAAKGTRLGEIARAVVALDPEIPLDDAREYVRELAESQVLVPELVPTTTDREPLGVLVERLRNLPSAREVAAALSGAEEALHAIDERGLGAAPDVYREVVARVAALPLSAPPARVFQAELVKDGVFLVVGERVLREVERGVGVLHALFGAPDDVLADFKSAFRERYEQREVPLVEVLDEETGIGFERSRGPRAADAADRAGGPPWKARDANLLRRLTEVLARGERELVLSEKDVRALAGEELQPLPDSLGVLATLLAPSAEAVNEGDFRVLIEGVSGPSGGRLLGRVCLADAELREGTGRHLHAEEALRPDAVFAEVVHLPEGGLGRVICRPVLRGYEIPYLGESSAPRERQIPVSDLWVSLRGERIVLRSASLGCEILPRLTSAHNFQMAGLGIYRFLCMLQSQGVASGPSWSWGPLGTQPFLPRVTCGRLVLSRALWNVEGEELRSLVKARGTAQYRAVQRWRAARGLPRLVAWADRDNLLLVDLDNVVSIEAFLSAARSRSEVRLVETFTGPEDLCVRGPEGRFVHEVVIPLLRASTDREAASRAPAKVISPPTPRREVVRSFPPGSEWLFVKVYTGPAIGDRILRDVVGPLVRGLRASAALDRWFFVRYRDPEPHLRLRFRGSPARLLAEVLPALHAGLAYLLRDGVAWRVQVDTYEREVERYGGSEGIELAERIFEADSDAVLAALETPEMMGEPEERSWIALCGMDLILSDLGCDAAGKLRVLGPQQELFVRELRIDSIRRRFSDSYRMHRDVIEEMLSVARSGEGRKSPALAALRLRSAREWPLMEELIALGSARRLTRSVEDLARSYVHMHVNRILRFVHRAQEAMLTHYLIRTYESEEARARSKQRE